MRKYLKCSEIEIRQINAALADKEWSHENLAAEIREKSGRAIARETVSRYLCRRLGCPPKVREHIENVLGFPPYTLTLQPPRKISGKSPVHDLKTRLNDDAVQDRLLGKGCPPSFADVARSSESFLARSVQEKYEKPAHYFQAAVILRVTWPSQRRPEILTYLREQKRGMLETITTGRAIIFGASYHIRELHPTSTMDLWLDLVSEDPGTASHEFIVGRSSVLIKLLNYKLDISEFNTKFSPLGIVTNDLRASTSVAYTAYVFIGEIGFHSPPRQAELARLSRNASKLILEEESANPEVVCRDSSGRPLCMDIAVWKALQSGRSMESVGTATFWKGFRVC
jgi:hypothetical protein